MKEVANASSKLLFLALGNTAALAAVLVVNTMANLLPIGGLTTGQVSALYPSLFTPAGVTFSIWAVIYLLLTGFVVLQWTQIRVPASTCFFQRLSPLFIFSCVCNSMWIVSWHARWIGLSVFIMVALLATLILLFVHIQKAKPGFSPLIGRWLELPFVVYLSWICVATIANLAAALVASGWDGAGVSPETWTFAMMVVAMLLGSYLTWRFGNPAFAAVIVWALLGLFLRWSDSEHPHLATGALVLLSMLSVFTIGIWLTRLVRQPPARRAL